MPASSSRHKRAGGLPPEAGGAGARVAGVAAGPVTVYVVAGPLTPRHDSQTRTASEHPWRLDLPGALFPPRILPRLPCRRLLCSGLDPACGRLPLAAEAAPCYCRPRASPAAAIARGSTASAQSQPSWSRSCRHDDSVTSVQPGPNFKNMPVSARSPGTRCKGSSRERQGMYMPPRPQTPPPTPLPSSTSPACRHTTTARSGPSAAGPPFPEGQAARFPTGPHRELHAADVCGCLRKERALRVRPHSRNGGGSGLRHLHGLRPAANLWESRDGRVIQIPADGLPGRRA